MLDRRIEEENTLAPHFIGSWTAIDPALCEQLIGFFDEHAEMQTPGYLGQGMIDETVKKSTDISIDPKMLTDPAYAIFNEYFAGLQSCLRDYRAQWPFLAGFVPKLHVGPFNMQRYEEGGHFSGVHSEKTSFSKLHRLLVWMTYLNTADDGGETEFVLYGLKVKPASGKTLIWPAEWTHAHRGCPVLSDEKYIVTGWFHMAI